MSARALYNFVYTINKTCLFFSRFSVHKTKSQILLFMIHIRKNVPHSFSIIVLYTEIEIYHLFRGIYNHQRVTMYTI